MTSTRVLRRGYSARAANIVTYLPLMVALAMRLASGPTAGASYLVLAVYALAGRSHIIRALALSWFFTMLSPGIAPVASNASLGRYAVVFAATASAIIHSTFLSRKVRLRPFTVGTMLLGLFIILHSFLFSPIVDVSVLKALSWTLAMATILAAWCGLDRDERAGLERELYRALVGVLVLSLPLAASGRGHLANSTGFQGILNHPQAFGPAMALLGAWTGARLFGQVKPPWKLVAILLACMGCILLSEARTAGVALVLGVGLSILLAPGFSGMSIVRMAPGIRSSRLWAILFVAVMAGVALAPSIAARLEIYITKSNRADVSGLLDAYQNSRGRLMGVMEANIAEHPWTGIGFGISSDPDALIVTRDPVLGLPIGASIEKGVVPLMVLEELGIFGAIAVALWVVALLRGASRGGLVPFAVTLTALLLNMGEATLFSPSGFGLLPLILLGWAYASGREAFARRRRLVSR